MGGELAALGALASLAAGLRWALGGRGADGPATPTAPAAALGPYRRPAIAPHIETVEIAAATFLMGSAGAGGEPFEAQHPAHPVTLSRFWMATVPVTQKLYRELMGESCGEPEGDDLPVNGVSWNDAVRCCNRLSDLEGLAPAYRFDGEVVSWIRTADGYRLPTEAEWEYAARGPDGRAYPWGNAPPSNQLCWNGEGNALGPGRRRAPAPVGQHPAGASPFGLMGMAGNVAEWCWDWYGLYRRSAEPQVDPTGPPLGCLRIVRGGSWDDTSPARVHTAAREKLLASNRYAVVGFRCARGAPNARPLPGLRAPNTG
jgi:formylglycine-generating enzyme required for sulfatase activity